MPTKQIVIPPKNIGSGTIKTLINRLVTHKYDRVTLNHRNYKGDMVYDGYSLMIHIYHDEKHIASWDSLPGRLTYFTQDLLKIGRLVNAITVVGYDLKTVEIEEGQEYPLFSNWTDFIATPVERQREINGY